MQEKQVTQIIFVEFSTISKGKVECGICGKSVDILEAWLADRIAICKECMREDHERSSRLWQRNP